MSLSLVHSSTTKAEPDKAKSAFVAVKRELTQRLGRAFPSDNIFVMVNDADKGTQFIDCGWDQTKADSIARKHATEEDNEHLRVLSDAPFIAVDPTRVRNISTDNDIVLIYFRQPNTAIALDCRDRDEADTLCDKLKASLIRETAALREEMMQNIDKDSDNTVIRPAAFNPR